MLRLKVILVTFVAAVSVTCSKSSDSQLVIEASPSRTYVINASAKSCLTRKTEDQSSPSPNDIQAAFFQVQYLDIYWPSDVDTLILSGIRLKFTGPQFADGVFSCDIAGDSLLALNQTWYSKGEPAVGGGEIASYNDPTNTSKRYTPLNVVSIDCPIICGGLSASTSFQASGTVDVIGFSRDSGSGELTPQRATGYISIESLGD